MGLSIAAFWDGTVGALHRLPLARSVLEGGAEGVGRR